jgi:hypothetical protein
MYRLATAVSIKHAEPTDRLSVNTLAGDSVSASGVVGLQVLVDGAPVEAPVGGGPGP